MQKQNSTKTNNNFRIIIWLAIFVVVLVISYQIESYWVGGDDTRLYYIYPGQFIRNFATNIVIGNALSNMNSYAAQSHLLPLLLFLHGVKSLLPGLNLQIFMYSFNIIFGVFFFYKSVSLYYQLLDYYSKLAVLFAALLYVFSAFVFYSVYSHQLLTVYLVSVFPLSFYLFTRGLLINKYSYPILVGLILSLTGLLYVSIPWLSAFAISLTPLLVYLLLRYKASFIKHCLVLFAVLTLLNVYWLFHFFSAIVLYSGSIGREEIFSTGFRQSNLWGVRLLASMNRLIYPLDFLYQYDIQANFGWKFFDIYRNWYLKLLPVNLIFTLIIFIGATFASVKDKLQSASVLLSLLLTIFLLTVNISPLGTEAFVFLSKHVPGFVMFRNMYDKFALPFSFIYSFALAAGAVYVLRRFKSKLMKSIFLMLIVLLVSLNIAPVVRGDFVNLKIWSTFETTDKLTDLNSNYLDMAKHISNQEDVGNYLLLPLSSGNRFMIQDEKNKDAYYLGVSPLVIFTGSQDYSGSLSFSYLSDHVVTAILEGRYEDANYYFKILNIRYVVVNKNISKDIQQSRFYGQSLYDSQMKTDFIDSLVGTKLMDFGDRYTLHEIGEDYQTERIFLSEDIHSFNGDNTKSSIEKVSNEEFIYKIQETGDLKYLNFLTTYNTGWDLYNINGTLVNTEDQFGAFGYANAWEINDFTPFLTEYGDYEIIIKFTPVKYSVYLYMISIVGFLILTFYLLYLIKNEK